METKNIQQQIDSLNKKMDLILEHLQQQKSNAEVVKDLGSDLTLIGNDAFKFVEKELDKRQIEINAEEIGDLLVAFLRNISNFRTLLDLMESAVDFGKEVEPIANKMIIDYTNKLGELQEKGYFEYLKTLTATIEQVTDRLSPDDLSELMTNLINFLPVIKELTQPEMLNKVNKALQIMHEMEQEKIPSYSLWRTAREMHKPEMKKMLGFGLTFIKKFNKN